MAECSSGKINLNLGEIKNCKICKKTLKKPIRLQCIHSFCKGCLHNSAKVETDGKLGWNCPTCGVFTDENETHEDTLLQKLIYMEESKGNQKPQVQVCEFCEEEQTGLMFCKECRMVICGRCKRAHIKAPATKHHTIENIENATGIKEDIIDEVIFCTKHHTNLVETYCNTCNEMLCKVCLEDHSEHVIQTIERSLSKLVLDLDDCMENITTKFATTDKQVKAIDEEISKLQETYAKWRIDSDIKLDMLINRLKAMKSLLDEQVNDEESRNLDILRIMKTKIQNQNERYNIITNMANLTKIKTQCLSRMRELQSGLLKEAKELKKLEVCVESVQITTPFVDDKSYEYTDEELLQMLRPVKYEKTYKVVDQSGIYNKTENRCEDWEQYLGQKFNKDKKIKIGDYCERVNVIQDSVFIGFPSENTIKQYNTEGILVHTYNNTHKTKVIKQACNGDVIVGGNEGLFVTNTEFNTWSLLQEGPFTDITIHGNKFSAVTTVSSEKPFLVTYEWMYHHNGKYQWKLISSFKMKRYTATNFLSTFLITNTTLSINQRDNNIIVCFDDKLVIYSFTGENVKTITVPGNNKQFCTEPRNNRILGTDRNGSLALGDFSTGNIYSISDVTSLDPNNMDQYLVMKNENDLLDMAIDTDTNLWILQDFMEKRLTKLRPS